MCVYVCMDIWYVNSYIIFYTFVLLYISTVAYYYYILYFILYFILYIITYYIYRYKNNAIDFSRLQVCIETFLFSPQYTDLATISILSKLTGTLIYIYIYILRMYMRIIISVCILNCFHMYIHYMCSIYVYLCVYVCVYVCIYMSYYIINLII